MINFKCENKQTVINIIIVSQKEEWDTEGELSRHYAGTNNRFKYSQIL